MGDIGASGAVSIGGYLLSMRTARNQIADHPGPPVLPLECRTRDWVKDQHGRPISRLARQSPFQMHWCMPTPEAFHSSNAAVAVPSRSEGVQHGKMQLSIQVAACVATKTLLHGGFEHRPGLGPGAFGHHEESIHRDLPIHRRQNAGCPVEPDFEKPSYLRACWKAHLG